VNKGKRRARSLAGSARLRVGAGSLLPNSSNRNCTPRSIASHANKP